jgi:hippurate hydrolase
MNQLHLPSPLDPPAGLFEHLQSIRRQLHQFPELSDQEVETARRIQAELDRLDIPYHSSVGGHGVVAELPGPAGVPVVALRADTDALPIHEETGLPFASRHPGVMHACGHDGHTTMLLGAAALLRQGPPLPAPVRLIWQPAEEKGTGARALMEAGVLDGVGLIFGGHVDRHYEVGQIIVTEGCVNASTDTFRLEIAGQDAHGARPHEGIDAIVVSSLLVMALQTIVSREVDPAHPSVLSVGRFVAGSAANVIAGRAVLEGTIRAQHPHVRTHLKEALARIANAVAQLHGARITVTFEDGTPPVINPPGPTLLARRAAQEVVGIDKVVPLRVANMGGEDFACYLEQVPGCYVRFGAVTPGQPGLHPAHSSRFDFDERALLLGARYFAAVARQAAFTLAGESAP